MSASCQSGPTHSHLVPPWLQSSAEVGLSPVGQDDLVTLLLQDSEGQGQRGRAADNHAGGVILGAMPCYPNKSYWDREEEQGVATNHGEARDTHSASQQQVHDGAALHIWHEAAGLSHDHRPGGGHIDAAGTAGHSGGSTESRGGGDQAQGSNEREP